MCLAHSKPSCLSLQTGPVPLGFLPFCCPLVASEHIGGLTIDPLCAGYKVELTMMRANDSKICLLNLILIVIILS